jgi:hypothetical protein
MLTRLLKKAIQSPLPVVAARWVIDNGQAHLRAAAAGSGVYAFFSSLCQPATDWHSGVPTFLPMAARAPCVSLGLAWERG